MPETDKITLDVWASDTASFQINGRGLGGERMTASDTTAGQDATICPTCGQPTSGSEGWSTGQCDDCYLDDQHTDADWGQA